MSKTRAERKLAAKKVEADFIRASNRRTQDRIMRDLVIAIPECATGISPAIVDIKNTIAGSTVLDFIVKATTRQQLITQDRVVAVARARLTIWEKQRRALERALNSGRVISSGGKWMTEQGKTFSPCMTGVLRVSEDWWARRRIRNNIIVSIERKTLPDTVANYLASVLHYDHDVQVYYTPPERIVDFIRGLRALLRASKRQVDFRLSSFALEV